MKKQSLYGLIDEIVNDKTTENEDEKIRLKKEDVVAKIEAGLRAAYKKDGCKGKLQIVFDDMKETVKLYAYYYIVNEIEPTGPAFFFKGETVNIMNLETGEIVKTGEVVALSKKVNTKVATQEVNAETGEIETVEQDYPTETLSREKPLEGQIALADAQEKWGDKAAVGKIIKEEIKTINFSKIAAATFLSTLTNGIKELKRKKIYEHYKALEGKTLYGTVYAVNDKFITLQLDYGNKTEVMPRSQAIKNEKFEVSQKVKLYVTSVEEGNKGAKIWLSQSNPEIVKLIFEENIPEVSNGEVEIIGQAREAGSRTKIGVLSTKEGVDAKGACVGKDGERIKRINDLLDGEKIDIFVWSNDPVELIAEALLPARVYNVTIISEKEKKAMAIVDDAQYSLAIGTAGQNVTLAAKATGWHIDIKKMSDAIHSGQQFIQNVKEKK